MGTGGGDGGGDGGGGGGGTGGGGGVVKDVAPIHSCLYHGSIESGISEDVAQTCLFYGEFRV